MEDSKWSENDIFYIFSREGIWLVDEKKAKKVKKDKQFSGQIPVYNLLIYGRLIELERLLRKAVLYLLKAEYGLNWRGSIPPDATTRMEEEKSYRNIVESTSQNLISFLEICEIESILLNEKVWKNYLKQHFPKHEETKSTIRKLKAIRNKIAHTRPCSYRDYSYFSECAKILTDSLFSFARTESWNKHIIPTEIEDWDDVVHFDNLFQTSVQSNQSHYRVRFDTIPNHEIDPKMEFPPFFDIPLLLERLCSLEDYFTFLEIPLPPFSFAISLSRKIPPKRMNWFLRTVSTHLKSSGVNDSLCLIPAQPMMPECIPEFCVPFSDAEFEAFKWLFCW